MKSVKNTLTLAQKALREAKAEMREEESSRLKQEAKQYLLEIAEAQKTLSLLERKLKNWQKKVDLYE